jgi:hypothetical protein
VSTAETPLAPTVYYQVAGTQVALPPTVRTDLAFTTQFMLPRVAAATQVVYHPQDIYVEIPVAIYVELTTDASAGNRQLSIQISTAQAGNTFIIPATSPATAGSTWFYTFSTGISVAYGFVGPYALAPLPVVALTASDTIEVAVNGLAAGDQINRVALTVVRIPTGPQLAAPTTRPAPSPVLV